MIQETKVAKVINTKNDKYHTFKDFIVPFG
jgi:hypothetical protein